ncbi:glycosyltransferase family 2 protein [Polaromonas sp.]|uniref:glycosyltransferase family 2 protein n=1 Tax=Polaromonas sp. TaxID=1869339 RepID=UPI00181D56AD|nr:glycosyltransferase family 2 protein [Polaromonas sp.]NML85806.1 glycosyltransferase family 2 protein [Polaromonas sp.]
MILQSLELTVLMPCLNEAKTAGRCVLAARRFLEEAGIDGEVLVADNGSIDSSLQIAEDSGARTVIVPERGYGAALIAGIDAARGRYVIMGDADDSYDFSDLSLFVERLRAGADLVMGNRFQGGIKPDAMPFLHRYLGNPVLSFVGRLFFRIPVGDFHCGLRGFNRDRVLALGLVTVGMEFASEMVAKSALAGLRIEQVPTTLRPDGRGRPPHLRTWRDGWRHLLFMLLFCPRWLFLLPGAALLGVGLAGFFVLAQGSLSFISLNLGIHSLLYMGAATVLGLQLIQFAFLTKWIGVLSGIVPTPRWLVRTKHWLNVEAGLIAGIALFVLGLVWSLRLVYDWGLAGYGALNPAEVMRSAIPAVTLMIVGVQAAAGALFAGALHFCWRSWTKRGHS